MEFKTSQSGETTLLFEPHEEEAIRGIAVRLGAADDTDGVKQQLLRTKQANPLAGFTELIGLAFAYHSDGLVPQGKRKAAPLIDPAAALEQVIRLKLASASAGSVGSTSQSQQVEAMLLQALAVCLQTQILKELILKMDDRIADA